MKGVIMCNLLDTIFYIKTNVLQDFHICVGVTLSQWKSMGFQFRILTCLQRKIQRKCMQL